MQRELIEKLEGLPVTFVTPDRFAIVGGTPHDDGSQMQGFQCGKCGGRCKFGQLNEFICGRKDCPLGV